jgi:DNA-binding beta-propeller fold protein YncE
MGATLYGLEIVDLTTMTNLHRFPLGAGTAHSLAVSPDGRTAYVADTARGEVGFIDTTNGIAGTPATVAGVRDLVLSADGQRLFAATNRNVVAIDATTRAVMPSPMLAGDSIPLGIALSPDGQRVAVATTYGGSNPTVTLVRTSDMSIEMAIPIATNVTGCATFPYLVAFVDNGLMLSWDDNCDALYQVDVGTHTQLTARSIATGRDCCGAISSRRLAVSLASHLVYALREDGNLVIMNPQTLTFALASCFVDMPGALVSSVGGDKLYISIIHRFNGGGADTLDVFDTSNSGCQHAAYTFMVANQSVFDMVVVASR